MSKKKITVVAEIGCNHMGRINLAKIMIDYIDNPQKDTDWHQVVWGIDRSSNQYLYQDGTFITSSNISAISSHDFQITRPFRVGSYNTTANGAVSSFNGSISNVSVYNQALTNTEILQNYNALKWRFV